MHIINSFLLTNNRYRNSPIFSLIALIIFFSSILPGPEVSQAIENGRLKGKNETVHLKKIMNVVFLIPPPAPGLEEEKTDLASLKTSLFVAGIRFTELSVKKIGKDSLKKYDIIILPNISARALKIHEIEELKSAVDAGSGLLFDGQSGLVEKFGITLDKKPVAVEQIRDLAFKDIPLYWRKPVNVLPVINSQDKDQKIKCIDERSKAPLVISAKYGKGKFIYFSPLFDPESGKGYGRFPFLIEMLSEEFGYERLVSRNTAAMYFDPGNRDFMDFENLVRQWRKYGIHTIYAGGWYGTECDYGKLIDLCHKNGILVCCWLELPMVSKDFWDKHPLWREKTALLEDAHVDWRYLMNLADEECRNEIFSGIRELLNKYDWDGVNLGELYFESTEGVRDPERFTPMNDVVREEFKDGHGFDPIEIFDHDSEHYWKTNDDDWREFADYRIGLCNSIKDYCLDLLSEIKEDKKNFEIVITAMDASSGPFLEYNIAEDTQYLLKLQKKYDITLQVQDEWMFWMGKPERYLFLGDYYRKYVKDPHRLELDFNVVECREKGECGFPSQKPAGEEVRQVVYNIDLNDARPVFYSEDSLYENDFKNINTVLARDTLLTQKASMKWLVNTPSMVEINTGKKELLVFLDGNIWRAGEGDSVVVPAGKHTLSFSPGPRGIEASMPRINKITSELISASFFNNCIEFSYIEYYASCYIIMNRQPEKIYIDNKLEECRVYEYEGGYCVKLPGRSHSVRAYVKKQ